MWDTGRESPVELQGRQGPGTDGRTAAPGQRQGQPGCPSGSPRLAARGPGWPLRQRFPKGWASALETVAQPSNLTTRATVRPGKSARPPAPTRPRQIPAPTGKPTGRQPSAHGRACVGSRGGSRGRRQWTSRQAILPELECRLCRPRSGGLPGGSGGEGRASRSGERKWPFEAGGSRRQGGAHIPEWEVPESRAPEIGPRGGPAPLKSELPRRQVGRQPGRQRHPSQAESGGPQCCPTRSHQGDREQGQREWPSTGC